MKSKRFVFVIVTQRVFYVYSEVCNEKSAVAISLFSFLAQASNVEECAINTQFSGLRLM